jgi:hypothetical protein
MRFFALGVRLVGGRAAGFGCLLVSVALSGCAWFQARPQSELDLTERPVVAILPIGLEVEITKLSYVKSMEGSLSPEEEARQLREALQGIQEEARWLFQSRLATGHHFRFVPEEQVAAVVTEFGVKPGVIPTSEQLAHLRTRVGADLVVVCTIEDYGKVRWLWAAAGMFADMTVETVIIGLASAWNPAIILGNVGLELLTSTPLWFGGAYVFGAALRPVRVEARAIETMQGSPVWQDMEVAFYAWGELKQLPESERGKKESQLRINLETAMAGLADALTNEGLTVMQLHEQYGK